MTPAERLVNHIREFLHGFDQEATPEAHEMSIQFSELCHALNDRLAKCMDFLRKGRRSEAVQAALTQPSVFELTETLNFEDAKSWLNLCLDLEMAPPPEIDLEAIERLREECTKEQLLEPLLREFRRLVHTGSRDERIHILRRLRSHDEDNPVWRENLEPLEQEQLLELRRKAGQSMAANDLESVLDIYTDMTAKHRVVDVPEEAIAEIESWLHKRRAKAAQEEGERLADGLLEALEQRNFTGMKPLLQAWERLVKYPDFKPTAHMADSAAKASAWYRDETQGRTRKNEFKKDLRDLQMLLNSPDLDCRRLEARWGALQAYEEPLPDGLEAAVTEALQRLEQAFRRHRRRRFAAVMLVVVILAAAGGGGSFFGIRFYQIDQVRGELSALWTAERYQDLERRLEQLKETPWLYEAAKAEFYVSRTQEKLAAETTRLAGLEKAMSGLMTVKSQAYRAGGETIAALISEARSYAQTDAEKDRIDNWELVWKSWMKDEQARVDTAGAQQVEGLERALQRARENSQASLPRRFGDLEKLRAEAVQVAEAIQSTSASVKERLNRVNRDITNWAVELEKAKSNQDAAARKFAAAMAEIPLTAGNLERWHGALEDFTRSYLQAPETPDLKRALAQYDAARDAVALGGFQVGSLDAATANSAGLQEQINNLPGGGAESVWRADLALLKAQAPDSREMKEELENLRMLDFYDLRQVKVRKKGETEWQTLFVPGAFHSKDVDEGKDGVKHYWGQVYGQQPDAAEAVPKFFSVTTDKYDVDYPENDTDRLIEAARYVRRILAKMPEDKLFFYLLETVDDLKQQTGIRTVPKAAILDILGKAIAKGKPMDTIGFEKYARAFDGLNINVAWYNHANPTVMALRDDIQQRIDTIPDTRIPLEILAVNQQLLMASLSRQVRCVGLVWKNPETGRVQPYLTRNGIQSLWKVLPAEHGMPNRFEVVTRADGDGQLVIPTAGTGRLVLGQLLFAPSDGKTCEEILQDLPPLKNREQIRWPASWPVNRRQFP